MDLDLSVPNVQKAKVFTEEEVALLVHQIVNKGQLGSQATENQAEDIEPEATVRKPRAEDLSKEEFLKLFTEKLMKRREASIGSKESIPKVDEKEGVIHLPRSVYNEDYTAGSLIVALAMTLGYEVKLYTYRGEVREILKEYDDYSVGMSFCMLDTDQVINLGGSTTEPIEVGRRFARGQFILGLATKCKFVGLLKKRNAYLGNNPEETYSFNGREIKREYLAKSLHPIFKEVDHQKEMLNVLTYLLKLVYPDKETLIKQLEKDIVSYDSLVKKAYSKTIVLNKGTKKEETKEVMSKLPNRSTLFLPNENKLVIEILKPVFEESPLTNSVKTLDSKAFLDTLIKAKCLPEQETERNKIAIPKDYAFLRNIGFTHKNILVGLSSIHARREEALQKFSQLTTTRLKLIRENEQKKDLRKKDVNQEMVKSLLLKDKKIAEDFAKDLSNLTVGKDKLGLIFASEKIKATGDHRLPKHYLLSETLISIESSLNTEEGKKFNKNFDPPKISTPPTETTKADEKMNPPPKRSYVSDEVEELGKSTPVRERTIEEAKSVDEILTKNFRQLKSEGKGLSRNVEAVFRTMAQAGYIRTLTCACMTAFRKHPVLQGQKKDKYWTTNQIAGICLSIIAADPEDDPHGAEIYRVAEPKKG